jgi:hypothetical protein
VPPASRAPIFPFFFFLICFTTAMFLLFPQYDSNLMVDCQTHLLFIPLMHVLFFYCTNSTSTTITTATTTTKTAAASAAAAAAASAAKSFVYYLY